MNQFQYFFIKHMACLNWQFWGETFLAELVIIREASYWKMQVCFMTIQLKQKTKRVSYGRVCYADQVQIMMWI